MRRIATPIFNRKLKRLTKQIPDLPEKLNAEFQLFTENPYDPTLRVHELQGEKIKQWSLTLDSDLLVIFQILKDKILLVDIGDHNQVY